MELLADDPFTVISRLGKNPQQLAEEFLSKIYEREAMPEDKRIVLEYEEKRKALEAREAAIEQEKMSVQMQARQAKLTAEYDTAIQGAIKASTLPPTPEAVGRVAFYMKAAIDQNVDLPIENAIKLVERDYANERKSMLSGDGERILEYIGEEALKKAHDALMKKKGGFVNMASPDGSYQKITNSAEKKQSWADFQLELDRIKNGT
jgi:hypothetical protein